MQRRHFLKLLGLFPFASRLFALPAKRRETLRCHIAGLQYHGGVDLIYRPGEALSLRREPRNPHDANAVAIYRGPIRIGYIPRRLNPPIATRMDRGERFSCHITNFCPDAPTWQRVEVAVYGEAG
ncbi:HIRAN domain-containing protein [Hydrogenimonas sp.]